MSALPIDPQRNVRLTVRFVEIDLEVLTESLRRCSTGSEYAATGVLERADQVETIDIRNRVLSQRRCGPVGA